MPQRPSQLLEAVERSHGPVQVSQQFGGHRSQLGVFIEVPMKFCVHALRTIQRCQRLRSQLPPRLLGRALCEEPALGFHLERGAAGTGEMGFHKWASRFLKK